MKSHLILTLTSSLLLAGPAFADKTAGQVVDDSTLQAEVKAKLLGNDLFGGAGINTEVRKGIVQLGGFVDKAEEAESAGKVAASVAGVGSVDNQLHVKQGKASMGQSLDDKVITSKVKGLIADANLVSEALKVNVDTYNGVVLLTGFVDTEDARERCAGIAANVDNVDSVINGIYVLD